MGKRVIVIRHGHYGQDHNLSEQGKNDIANLAIKLLPEIQGEDIICLTSMAPRALQSAEILQKKWAEQGVETQFEKKYEIWSGNDAGRERRRLQEDEQKKVSVHDFDWLQQFIEKDYHEVIVVVTHLEFVEDFPELLGMRGKEIDKGTAMILGMETKNQRFMR